MPTTTPQEKTSGWSHPSPQWPVLPPNCVGFLPAPAPSAPDPVAAELKALHARVDTLCELVKQQAGPTIGRALTVPEVADVLRCGPEKVRRLSRKRIGADRLRAIPGLRPLRFAPEEVQRFRLGLPIRQGRF